MSKYYALEIDGEIYETTIHASPRQVIAFNMAILNHQVRDSWNKHVQAKIVEVKVTKVEDIEILKKTGEVITTTFS